MKGSRKQLQINVFNELNQCLLVPTMLGSIVGDGDTSVKKDFLWRICSLLSNDSNCAKEEEWNFNFKSDHVAVCDNYDH